VELSDRRAEPRNPELLWGKAIFKDVAKDCVINDLSTSGARLRLTAFAALPDRFDLFIFETRRTYKAAVQWRAGDQAGGPGPRRDGGGFARRRGKGGGLIASPGPSE